MADNVSVEISVDGRTNFGIEQFQAELRRYGAQLGESQLREGFLDQVGAVWLSRIRRRFMSQEAPDGSVWPVSGAALRRAAEGLTGKGTLYDTGRLYNSIQYSKLGPGRRRIGTDVPYAIKHQEGLDGMPNRVFIGLAESDLAVLGTLIDKFMEDAGKVLQP